jgi:hypothetical protein
MIGKREDITILVQVTNITAINESEEYIRCNETAMDEVGFGMCAVRFTGMAGCAGHSVRTI